MAGLDTGESSVGTEVTGGGVPTTDPSGAEKTEVEDAHQAGESFSLGTDGDNLPRCHHVLLKRISAPPTVL